METKLDIDKKFTQESDEETIYEGTIDYFILSTFIILFLIFFFIVYKLIY